MRTGLWLLFAACGAGGGAVPDAARDGGPDAAVTHVAITATIGSTRFVTREHLLAAGEMQISGEPLAEAMGRRLRQYSRDQLPPDLYADPVRGTWIDLAGFSTAIESYEYSKQHMNAVAFELGAGTSLVYGPLVNAGETGPAATAKLAALIQRFAVGSNALGRLVFPAGTYPTGNVSGDTNPTGAGNPLENPLGWPGIWPTLHVFASFDPAIDPTSAEVLGCAITSDDTPGSAGAVEQSADYECNATTLHLRDRAAQIDSTIGPGADGFATWKYGLWSLNYLQVMHDAAEAAATSVAASDAASVGTSGNTVRALAPNAVAGTYLGSSNIEGFQAQMFLAMADNRAEDWLRHLSTTDGTTLGGFATIGDALAYDYTQPVRWFPRRIAVSETDDGSGFPHPHYAIADAGTERLDLAGLALGYATIFAVTDAANRGVGGAQSARVVFDGDPFDATSLHDRALAMMRVAVIDLDRMTTTDDSIATLAYSLIALRTVSRALSSQLELYSNNTPDTAVASSPLDAYPLHAMDPALTFSGRVAQMIREDAERLYGSSTDASGHASGDTLDDHAAAVRGLFAAYLATGDTHYRTRAIAVFDRMVAVFYDRDARMFTPGPAPVDEIEITPLRFALVQSALRDMYEIVATRPGGEARELQLEPMIARWNKLVLNGWDDRDRDQRVSTDECVTLAAGIPHGGLQMAERTLTGELGRGGHNEMGMPGFPTLDRDMDCVPEIDDAHLPAALADSITFHLVRTP